MPFSYMLMPRILTMFPERPHNDVCTGFQRILRTILITLWRPRRCDILPSLVAGT